MNKEKQFQKSLKKRWLMQFQLDGPDEESYDGIIIHIAESFITISEFWDFAYDGFEILPKWRIADIRDGRFEECANEILRHSGEFDVIEKPQWLFSTKRLTDIFEQLKIQEIWPAVECVRGTPPDSVLYVGPVIRVGDDSFCIHSYDAEGEWETEHEIPFQEILRVEFESRYCRYFNAYMRDRNPLPK